MVAAVEGVEGVYNNPAAPAVREPFSLKWFDYDVIGGFSFPGAYRRTDFGNRGEHGDPDLIERTDDFNYYNAGGQLQFGELGVTVMADFIRYTVQSLDGGERATLTLGRMHACAGYGFFDNQLVVGAGARIALVNLDNGGIFGTSGALISLLGAAPEAGLVIKPNDKPWRIGGTARAAVSAGNFDVGHSVVDPLTGVRTAGGLITPERVTQPWEIEAGVAYQIGPRPLNPSWINPSEQEAELKKSLLQKRETRKLAREQELARFHGDAEAREKLRIALAHEDEFATQQEDNEIAGLSERLYAERQARYLNWPRERLLLLASLLMTGPSTNAVALEGFIDQRRELVGEKVSYAPRFGVEGEPIPNFVRLRAGVYIEPSRFADGNQRQHFTFGADLRGFTWNLWGLVPNTTVRFSGQVDVAPRYENFGFGIGVWH